jgi:hypothetical protein
MNDYMSNQKKAKPLNIFSRKSCSISHRALCKLLSFFLLSLSIRLFLCMPICCAASPTHNEPAYLRPWELPQPGKESTSVDKRLSKKVSVWQAKISLAELLAVLQQQSGVELAAWEPQLQRQQVTVYVEKHTLSAMMVQLAKLFGLHWYVRPGPKQVEYVLSYGSQQPIQQATAIENETTLLARQRRANRIADYMEALQMDEAQLRELAKTDPMLAGTLLCSSEARSGIEILATIPPESLRTYVEDGHVFLKASDLPDWAKQALRKTYRTSHPNTFGVASEDAFVSQYRLWFTDLGQYTPADGGIYDLMGGEWQGLSFSGALTLGEHYVAQHLDMSKQPTWWPKDTLPIGRISIFTANDPNNPREYVPSGVALPGQGDIASAQEKYPELTGVTENPSAAFYAAYEKRRQQREAQLTSSPWKEDPQLACKRDFAVKNSNGLLRISALLEAVARQTKYTVIASYYDEKDAAVGIKEPAEPLYLVLNRASGASDCTWGLAGSILYWRYNDWFALEIKHSKMISVNTGVKK